MNRRTIWPGIPIAWLSLAFVVMVTLALAWWGAVSLWELVR